MAGMPIRRMREVARELNKEKWLEVREASKSERQSPARRAADAVLEAGIVPICTNDRLLIELEAIRVGAMMTSDWAAGIQAIMRKAEIHSGNTGKFQDAGGFSSMYDLFARVLTTTVQHGAGAPSKDPPGQGSITHQPVPALDLGDGANGHASSVAPSPVQRGAEGSERVSGPMESRTLQVHDNNGGVVDTGHTENAWQLGGWDGSVHRDLQSHEADSEGVPKEDKDGVGD